MDWKKILWPSKWKILFIIIYAILFVFFPSFSIVSDSPISSGFPFTYSINACGLPWSNKSPNCFKQFYPEMLLLDILIPVAIYLAIGLWESRKKY